MKRASKYKIAGVMAALTAFGAGAATQAAQFMRQAELKVAQQPMTTALQELSHQFNIQIASFSEDVSGKEVAALSGKYSLSGALSAVLRDSGLRYIRIDDRTIAVGTPARLAAQYNGPGFRTISFNSSADYANNLDVYEGDESLSEAKGFQFDEIVVTATKRAQRLQDVPMAISAFTTADLENNGIESFKDFARQLPGVNLIEQRRNRAQFVIRGISTGAAGTRSQDEVSTYINEMPMNGRYFAIVAPDLRLYDIERVEVLRGPQGTLFGSGSLGGAVRVITNKPKADAFDASGQVDLGLTKGGAVRARYSAMVNVPLVEDELAVRAVGYYRDEEGYLTNIGTGVDKANTVVDWGGRVMVNWTPSENLDISFMALHQDSKPEDSDAYQPDLGKFILNTPSSNQLESTLTFYNGTFDYDLGFATLSSSTTYAQSDAGSSFGFTLIADMDSFAFQNSEFVSEELRLVSQTDGNLEWIVGAFFFDQKANQGEFLHFSDVAGTVAQYNLTGVTADGELVNILSRLNAQEKAIFGELTYHLTDQISVSGGLRWSTSDMNFINLPGGIGRIGGFVNAVNSGGGDINDFAVPFDQNVSGDSSPWTGKASLTYRPNDDQTYYLLASKGFRVGQANTASGPDPVDPENGLFIPSQFEPDSLWNFEVGAKTSWMEDRIVVNAAIYYIPWDNIQISGSRPSDFVTFTGNAGKAISMGVEFETLFRPMAGLELGVNLNLQDTEIKELSELDSTVTGAVEGDSLPNSPDFQISGFAEYYWTVRESAEMFVRLEVQHIGKARNTFSNTPGLLGVSNAGLEDTDAYENVNLNIGLSTEHWRFTAYVENLTNNDDFIRIDPNTFFTNRFNSLRPRTVGMRVQYHY